jgi:hypothetical protein
VPVLLQPEQAREPPQRPVLVQPRELVQALDQVLQQEPVLENELAPNSVSRQAQVG